MELKFLESLQSLHSPILNYIMIFITSLGNGGFIWIVAAIFLLFQNNNKLKREGFSLAVALIIFSVFGLLILKPIIARPRPFTVDDVAILIREPMIFLPIGTHWLILCRCICNLLLQQKKRSPCPNLGRTHCLLQDVSLRALSKRYNRRTDPGPYSRKACNKNYP